MGTSFNIPIEAFLGRVEADRSFFNYLQLSDDKAVVIARQRALSYLFEACSVIMIECMPEVDFNDYDIRTNQFNFTLLDKEVFLLSSIMYEMYLDRDIAKLKTLNVNYTSTDLRVFDPSNARKTFLAMYEFVSGKNNILKTNYSESERDSGSYIGINFSAYDDE